MHDTLSGLTIAHNNHNLVTGIQNVVVGGVGYGATEVAKNTDCIKASWLATHYVGVFTVTDLLAIGAGLLVLSGLVKFYWDCKARWNESKYRTNRRKR